MMQNSSTPPGENIASDDGRNANAGWSAWVSPSAYVESYRAGPSREKGTRRKKIAGYISAANQARQNYMASYYTQNGDQDLKYVDSEAGGSWTDADLRSRDMEEMILFPSYARRRGRESSTPNHSPSPSKSRSQSRSRSLGRFRDREERRRSSVDLIQQSTESVEKDVATIEVDVRGWIFQPHKGALTTKNKILMGLARQICGLPAQGRGVTLEDQEASSAAAKALEEGHDTDDESAMAGASTVKHDRAEEVQPGVVKRLSWKAAYAIAGGQPPPSAATPAATGLTAKELDTAHGYLKTRLTPFMHRPIPNIPVTVFFYNSETSQSRIVSTNDYGHFAIRAGLPFLPTHVRVLASEKLNVTEDVKLLESHGLSIISDIDDTIKHSAVAMGAREIFRNTFIRELGDLTIPGVTELYNTLALLDVPIHYVSNSPWQVFPMLQEYFSMANLPMGSFHLKQYSGMLQGIFEPVAERKKSSLDRIFSDFPNRRFMLFGDSGEADLEVYTEVAMLNPGRVVAVFIRDVTTKEEIPFFASSHNGGEDTNHGREPKGRKPPLPKRPSSQSLISTSGNERYSRSTHNESHKSRPMATTNKSHISNDLIDFSSSDDEGPQVLEPMKGVSMYGDQHKPSVPLDSEKLSTSTGKSKPPPKPTKPSFLRGNSLEGKEFPQSLSIRPVLGSVEETSQKSAAPLKMSSSRLYDPYALKREITPPTSTKPIVPSPLSMDTSNLEEPSMKRSTSEDSPSRTWRRQAFPKSDSRTISSQSLPLQQELLQQRQGRHPDLRRAATAASTGQTAPPATEVWDPASGIEKKVWLWNQRWERAREILEPRGITLRSWRKGTDILELAVSLVENARPDQERKPRS